MKRFNDRVSSEGAGGVALLEVAGLEVHFGSPPAAVRAVDRIDLRLDAGEILGLVGESGCGKSATALAMLGLLPPGARVAGGEIRLGGRDLLRLPERAMRQVRGREMAMIFQDPMTSLNPAFTVGNQIEETLRVHLRQSREQARRRGLELLDQVGIAQPRRIAESYPHQLSGGMRQRVMIAIAISCEPRLLIADEPTTALDVTIQAQILELLGRLRHELDMAVLLITHDFGVVAETCDRVAVMYAGRIMEEAPTGPLFAAPRHPYTVGLLGCIPRLDEQVSRLRAIPGQLPAPDQLPAGCRFATRCPRVVDDCWAGEPQLVEVESGHRSRCWLDQAREEAR